MIEPQDNIWILNDDAKHFVNKASSFRLLFDVTRCYFYHDRLHLLTLHHPTPSVFPFGLLVSFAAGNANELLDASGVPQRLGVLHVLGDDLVQSATDRRDGVIRHGLPHQAAAVGSSSASSAGAVVVVATSRQTVHQVPHGIFTWSQLRATWWVEGVGDVGRRLAGT